MKYFVRKKKMNESYRNRRRNSFRINEDEIPSFGDYLKTNGGTSNHDNDIFYCDSVVDTITMFSILCYKLKDYVKLGMVSIIDGDDMPIRLMSVENGSDTNRYVVKGTNYEQYGFIKNAEAVKKSMQEFANEQNRPKKIHSVIADLMIAEDTPLYNFLKDKIGFDKIRNQEFLGGNLRCYLAKKDKWTHLRFIARAEEILGNGSKNFLSGAASALSKVFSVNFD